MSRTIRKDSELQEAAIHVNYEIDMMLYCAARLNSEHFLASKGPKPGMETVFTVTIALLPWELFQLQRGAARYQTSAPGHAKMPSASKDYRRTASEGKCTLFCDLSRIITKSDVAKLDKRPAPAPKIRTNAEPGCWSDNVNPLTAITCPQFPAPRS